jgi:cytochrome b subunit of formate dehydrogenase
MERTAVSKQTRNNWLVDAAVAIGGLIAAISGVYFLYFPVGGYQGGRNPWYNVTILFRRSTWDDLHTWGGIAMIVAAVIHVVLHWNWIASMSKRVARDLAGKPPFMNNRGRFNVAVDATIAVSFLVTALSGVYLLFVPGGSEGRLAGDPRILFDRTTWDVLHTWAGVTMIVAALVHFAIHWGWVVKVTRTVAHALPALLPPEWRRRVRVES